MSSKESSKQSRVPAPMAVESSPLLPEARLTPLAARPFRGAPFGRPRGSRLRRSHIRRRSLRSRSPARVSSFPVVTARGSLRSPLAWPRRSLTHGSLRSPFARSAASLRSAASVAPRASRSPIRWRSHARGSLRSPLAHSTASRRSAARVAPPAARPFRGLTSFGLASPVSGSNRACSKPASGLSRTAPFLRAPVFQPRSNLAHTLYRF